MYNGITGFAFDSATFQCQHTGTVLRNGKQFLVNISNFEDLRGDCYSVNLKSIFRNLQDRRRPPGV